ncbi:hypothetical protein M2192_007837 [Bradyrhizobium elkanii USDA 61]|jgi:hypothetical protein|uniref:Uncharacterized protein n=1 Tax=Bradyrhizobium elkanii TaxID=29448 RepID=A0A8I1Y5V6_BRAEL|nr:hypothetical protein [Bradyrhizobium elkanii]MCS4010877.1 hypothetical protein [Bradyrhizobium elkanii USDA 61]MBP1293762.1 hypothetical protein [Bradyrhizobium elkanii]MCP1925654.1 hypothetical protein [Bradyrhizobium elkanii]MCS3451291.1 hypothetical protein [Bradyrhizobium elkanii]MCS3476854.1 hypothetical protein [Bradyrhizobium elkanii]
MHANSSRNRNVAANVHPILASKERKVQSFESGTGSFEARFARAPTSSGGGYLRAISGGLTLTRSNAARLPGFCQFLSIMRRDKKMPGKAGH